MTKLMASGKGLAAQASIEVIAMLGVFLIILIIYAVAASGVLSHIWIQGDYHDAYTSVQALASAADSVFAQGEGSSKQVQLKLPTTFNSSKSFVGRPSSAMASPQNTISVNLGGTDVFANTRAPLSGTLPSRSGEYTVSVVSHGTYVSINPYLIDAYPGSLHAYCGPGQSRQATVTVRVLSNGVTDVNLSSQWSYPNVNISISSHRFVTANRFIAYGQTDVPVVIRFNASAGASGTHHSELVISAASNGVAESISIPISLDVTG